MKWDELYIIEARKAKYILQVLDPALICFFVYARESYHCKVFRRAACFEEPPIPDPSSS